MTLTQQLVQQIIDSVDAYSLIFRGNRIIMANSMAMDWLSLSSETLASQKILDLIHSSSRHTALHIFDRLLAGETRISARLLIAHPVFGNIWIDLTVKPADYFDDKDYWIVTFTPRNNSLADNVDVQPQVQLEILDSEEADEPYAVLTSIVEENKYVDTALEDFLTTLHDIIPYDSASIALIDDNIMQFVAARGFSQNINLSDLQFSLSKRVPKSSEILYENLYGKVQIIQDTTNHSDWIHVKGTEHIKSWMGVELRYDNKLLGYLNIDSSAPHFFTREHARHAMGLSGQAINALVYTRLYKQFYDDYQEKHRLQETLVKVLISTETMYAVQELLFSSDNLGSCLPELVDIVSSSMIDTTVSVIIFNTVTGNLLYNIQSDNNTWTIFQQAIGQEDLDEGQMPNYDLNIPAEGILRLENSVQQARLAVINRRGALIALRDADAEPFNESNHELIVTIAGQIDIALENEQLNKQVKQQNEHLERLVGRRTSQLSIERKRLKAILDSTAEGIFYMENFKIQYANPAFCYMVGYELEDLYGKPLSFIRVSPENSEPHNFTSLLDNPLEVEPGRSETRLKRQDETEFYASIRFSLVGSPGEEPVRMVAIARDISQERKLYIQRARFIANAAHELRTPLSSLILRLHMLGRQPERVSTHLQSLDKVTAYLKVLVEELLTLSRFERGSIILATGEYVLQDLIHQAANEHLPFAEEKQVTLHLDLPDEPVTAKVDGTRIHQMLGNLVLNGINYSLDGENVSITMTVEIDLVGNENVVIHVIDEGAGIEPDLLPDDIFEPFSRPSGGSRKETGMGLALVREIVLLHGGTVYAKSKLNEGATFRVSLPLN